MEFILLLCAFLFSFMVVKIVKNSKAKKLPPGPKTLPIIGNIHQLYGSLRHHRLRDLAKKYGPLMRIQLGEVSTLVVSSPEVAKEVLRTHDMVFTERHCNLTNEILTYGCSDLIFAPYGNFWRQLRKICTVELLSSKRVQTFRSIREEEALNMIRSICSQKGSVVNVSRKIFSLTYAITALEAVIKETMRLHPPTPLLVPRESTEQCEINGYEIPAKSRVTVNQWAIGRDPTYWNEADKFNPERFLDSEIDYKGNDFRNIPFGAGRGMCPGISFALPNIELPLAQLLFHFDWKLAGDLKPEDLDMDEIFGGIVRRKNDLLLISIPYFRSSVK